MQSTEESNPKVAWAKLAALVEGARIAGRDIYRRSAALVDKILKGTRPADLPVETPTQFELVVNLKAAKMSGLTISESFLLLADKR
jgi:ABC-type uncharacterized transport system substrate-binding protein